MAQSAAVATGDQATAAQYNNLRNDAHSYFIPASAFAINAGAAAGAQGDFDVLELDDAATESVRVTGFFYKAPTTVYVVIIPEGTGNIEYTVTTDFAAAAELYTTNSDSIAATTQAVTLNTIERIDVTAAFTGVADNDFFGLIFTRNGAAVGDTVGAIVNVLGLLVIA